MIQALPMIKELKENGFLLRDNFLPRPLFKRLQEQVLDAWNCKKQWNTKVKGAGAPVTLPYQDQAKLKLIRDLLDNEKQTRSNDFTYLYHTMNDSQCEGNLVAEIYPHIISGWCDELRMLAVGYKTAEFSLTAFGPYCYLDSHTDFSTNDAAPYQIALILYLQSAALNEDGCLQFDYMGKSVRIAATANRSVLFVPTHQTNHSVSPLTAASEMFDHPRLAVSGWLI
jgi:Rps23 Pro-64 3,4-dihydroxylase Tpa1-like proline 4-hydroxylase